MNDWQIGMLSLRGEPISAARTESHISPSMMDVQDAIVRLGEATAGEIGEYLGMSRESAQGALARLRSIEPRIKCTKNTSKAYVYWLER